MFIDITVTIAQVWLCVRVCQGLVYRWDSSAERAVKVFVGCLTDKQTHSHTAQLTRHLLEPIYQVRSAVLFKKTLGVESDSIFFTSWLPIYVVRSKKYPRARFIIRTVVPRATEWCYTNRGSCSL